MEQNTGVQETVNIKETNDQNINSKLGGGYTVLSFIYGGAFLFYNLFIFFGLLLSNSSGRESGDSFFTFTTILIEVYLLQVFLSSLALKSTRVAKVAALLPVIFLIVLIVIK